MVEDSFPASERSFQDEPTISENKLTLAEGQRL
jgi:hypothetical protein